MKARWQFRNPHLLERPDRGDPAIDLWGFGGLLCEAFYNSVDEAVGVMQEVDRNPELVEQVVRRADAAGCRPQHH